MLVLSSSKVANVVLMVLVKVVGTSCLILFLDIQVDQTSEKAAYDTQYNEKCNFL